MRSVLTKAEGLLFIATLCGVGLAVWGPTMPQTPIPHDLADWRRVLGIYNGWNVFSTVPIALAAATGGWALARSPTGAISNMQRAMALLFLCGVALLAHGACLNFLDPQPRFLTGQRHAMAFVMAGLLGLAAAGHVSERAGACLGLGSLALGVLAVKVAVATGNLFPWGVFHFVTVLLLWSLAVTAPRAHALPITWTLVLLAYVLARVLETNDHAIFAATREFVSGQTLANGVTSFLAWPVVAGLRRAADWRRDSALDPFLDDALQRLLRRAVRAEV